jgi:predicted ATPase
VAQTIRQAIGAKDGLAAHIGERQMLLLLDNFEQVVGAAPELSDLVEACPNLSLLVTSRERLSVRGEVSYEVPSLTDAEGLELFCARARTQADKTIAELSGRLENLPLAIELAAARTRVLSPAQILARLSQRLDLLKGGRDAEARQQTLRATIDWSYELLSPNEQQLFGRLSVFRGGCTVEAAEAVAGADLEVLQSLVDKSLLRHREERFWMLEMIREFATERLEESGEAQQVRGRHAHHFVMLAEEIAPNLGSGAADWLDLIAREHDNFRAALDHLALAAETQLVLRLAGAISRFWYLRGYLFEGSQRLEAALESDSTPTSARGKALNGAAVITHNLGDYGIARERAQEALSLHRQLGDRWATAYSTFMLGNSVGDDGDPEQALELLAESARAFGDLGDEHYVLNSISNSAWMHTQLGHAERARELNQEVLVRARRLGDERAEAHSLSLLAVYHLDQDRLEDAPTMLQQAIRIDHKFGDVQSIGLNFRRLAYALALQAKAAKAARLLAKGIAVLEEIGFTAPWVAEFNEKARALIRTQLAESEFADASEQGRALTLNDAVMLALASSD